MWYSKVRGASIVLLRYSREARTRAKNGQRLGAYLLEDGEDKEMRSTSLGRVYSQGTVVVGFEFRVLAELSTCRFQLSLWVGDGSARHTERMNPLPSPYCEVVPHISQGILQKGGGC